MDREIRERAEKYIDNVRHALKSIKVEPKCREIVDLAKAYLTDAEHYFAKADYITSIACSSYAEGLLDALRLLGLASFSWKVQRERPPRVLVGGVFDIVHPGHIYFLKEASKLGRVIVVVARDETVRRLKGREPIIPEHQRLEVIKSLKYVSEAYLGECPLNIRATIDRLKPDIVVLGPDQDVLENELKKLGVKYIKLRRRESSFPLCSTSKIIERIKKLLS